MKKLFTLLATVMSLWLGQSMLKANELEDAKRLLSKPIGLSFSLQARVLIATSFRPY